VNRSSSRPLYSGFAWAYDLIIAGPVSSRCDFVERLAAQRRVLPASRILDAGCGTGSYSVELARRGYAVTGLDSSAELASLARAKAEEAVVPVTFQVGGILELSSRPSYDGILCRGVLNDIIDGPSRQKVFFSFARALRKEGILILDVREWTNSALRKQREPVFERVVENDRGTLTFRAVTRLEHETRQLLVAESYILKREDGVKTLTEHDFVMQCWTRDELHDNLINAGFGSVAYFGDYDSSSPIGSTDRIVAVASLER
jgi:2-polyprenyl-3-methyl-5-hydroxy-6-metoxy-1,4-benzoquinol methylase